MSQANEPFVEFYPDSVHLTFRSSQEGRPIFEDRDHIRIFIPGDNRTLIEREASDEDKQRYAAAYRAYKDNETSFDKAGTPLKAWAEMTPAMIRNLAHFNIFSVEHMAAVPDTALQNLGPGMREFRTKAIAYLDAAKTTGTATHLAAENEKLKSDIEDLKRQVATLAARAEGSENQGGRGRR